MYEPIKLYLNQQFVWALRERYLSDGRSNEDFDKWLDANVVVVDPLEETRPIQEMLDDEEAND